jgi:alkylhydroperoxidase family enzyme
VENDEALKKLPGEDQRLPAWALILVEPLPRTTAAMLELDYLQRAKNPLGELLAAKVRWTVADAIGCKYGKRTAEGDLRRAGLGDDELKKLSGETKDLPEADRAVLFLARKLTKAGQSVTDDEVAEVVKQFGAEKAVAIAHTVAFANFQNRVFLAIGVESDGDAPMPPLELHVDREKLASVAAPERPAWERVKAEDAQSILAKPDWKGYGEVDKLLTAQKARKPRIPPPDSARLDALPAEIREQADSKVLWNRVSVGYQPKLTRAWFACMAAWRAEAKVDRVFANSMFWIVTRSNECFY